MPEVELGGGRYRFFFFRDKTGNPQIISLLVSGMLYGLDPRFPGNHRGHTMLIVAIDNFEKQHISLQLDLDRYVRENGEKLQLWHDGRINRGKGSDLLDFVSRKAPWLIKSGEVFLGELPANRYARWADAKDFLDRVVSYALIREEFKKAQ